MRKKLFRRIYNDEYIPDDDLLHIFFDSSMLRLDITAYDSDIYSAYSKFFDAFSQAKRKRIFPKDLATFIDSFLVDPRDFNIHTCHPFNTTNDDYYFDYEGDDDYTYIWLNVSLNFSRGDIFMDENISLGSEHQLMPDEQKSEVVTQPPFETKDSDEDIPYYIEHADELAEDERISAARNSNNQESSLDTVTDMSSSDYFKAQNDQPVIDNSRDLSLREKDLAEDEKLKTYQMEVRDTSTTSGGAVVPAIIFETPIASTEESFSRPNLDTLIAEINQYLNVAKYSVIEVGKRLILAKKLVPHGEWANWLKNNFNLKRQSATNFMHIAERFGTNSQTFGNFDISTFKPSQLIALLALPKGKEETFIAQKAAEGTPVSEMSVKTLHSEIKKFPANLTHDDSVSNHSLLAPASVPDSEISSHETLTFISHTNSPQQSDIAYSSTPAHDVDKTLDQLFAAASSLLHADNLQSVVSSSADNDLQTLEQQLSQLAAIHDELTNYLAIWKESNHKKDTIDNAVVSSSI